MKFKQIRGGTWLLGDWGARCAYRYRGTPGYRDGNVGFRCCFSPLFVKINKERLENEN